ncbi:MAG: sugar-binding domain-containing protein [Candidatus Cryptobacteroides sp.]
MKRKIFLLALAAVLLSCQNESTRMSLSGEWGVYLDSLNIFSADSIDRYSFDRIELPGTTDDAGLGFANKLKPALEKPQMLHLTRKHSYVGAAYYTRKVSIPASWSGKNIIMHLERIIWESEVWVDGVNVGQKQESLTVPHRFDLTDYCRPGTEHQIVVKIDNRKKYDNSDRDLAHSYTDDTQVKWNGILGDMYIEALPELRITDVRLYPDAEKREVTAIVEFNPATDKECHPILSVKIKGISDRHTYVKSESIIDGGTGSFRATFSLGQDAPLWDEFNPYLYSVETELVSGYGNSSAKENFGLRTISGDGNVMLLNGSPMFLRGTLECCVFPDSGTPPTEKDGWYKVFRTASEYGLNHLRFHSWCPPEAAFEAADELGFYLQVELPVWTGNLGLHKPTADFIENEAERIIGEYGNHPSFCLLSIGNELKGNFDFITGLVSRLKNEDSRHLYTSTSFSFQQGHGTQPEPVDDFYITQWTNDGWVRGQGVFNQLPPSFDKDYNSATANIDVPLVTHEIGQYSVYPDLREIEKYKGTLLPLNFIAIKEDLEKKGLLHKADDYLESSGKLAAILYKEEIERALKTKGISGFQLLDLHDFPGQGTALVGLLDAFWDSKGIITGEEFRKFCSPVVPLLSFPKAVYTNDERFTARIELSNYSDIDLNGRSISWTVSSPGKILTSGSAELADIRKGLNQSAGVIDVALCDIEEATQLNINLSIDGTSYSNNWKIWVYPASLDIEFGKVRYTKSFEEALALLQSGETVLFNPDWKSISGIEGKFVPVFWSPVHFPNQAGTMGVLCNPAHPALKEFPTEGHTDWQWWDLNINSTTLVVDSLKGGAPIVEMIDNFLKNRRLASLYEGKSGNGKLMIATFDLYNDLDRRPVARQMLYSVLKYMNSPEFNPDEMNGFEEIGPVFGNVDNTKQSATGIYRAPINVSI